MEGYLNINDPTIERNQRELQLKLTKGGVAIGWFSTTIGNRAHFCSVPLSLANHGSMLSVAYSLHFPHSHLLRIGAIP